MTADNISFLFLMFREFSLVLLYFSSNAISMHIFWILSCDIYTTYIDLQCQLVQMITILVYTCTLYRYENSCQSRARMLDWQNSHTGIV